MDPPPPAQPSDPLTVERDISIHVFTASSALVGVCLTVISIVRSLSISRGVETLVDDLLAVDAMVFLCSCVLSYSALRTPVAKRMHRVERVADAIFLLGMGCMATVCGMIVWALV